MMQRYLSVNKRYLNTVSTTKTTALKFNGDYIPTFSSFKTADNIINPFESNDTVLDPKNIIDPYDLSLDIAKAAGDPESKLLLENFNKITIPKDLKSHLKAIVKEFVPHKNCFGYGSGVFPQQGNQDYSKNQIDMLLSVENPLEWHKLNIKKNPDHYSSLKYTINIPKIFEKIQGLGAGIYFNPFVKINGSEVKYGILSHQTLIGDLKNWNTFYLAGRLQKPTVNLSSKGLADDLELGYWLQRNLISAALLSKKRCLNKYGSSFTDLQFFTELCTLSYLGDIRFKLGGENPNKSKNIVLKNMNNFKLLYDDILNEIMLWDEEKMSRYLPNGYTLDNYHIKLEKCIAKSSSSQAVKGVFTAGIVKSCKYAWAKKIKAMKK